MRGWRCQRSCVLQDVGWRRWAKVECQIRWMELLWLVRSGESGDAEASPRGMVVVVVVVGTVWVMSRKARQREA